MLLGRSDLCTWISLTAAKNGFGESLLGQRVIQVLWYDFLFSSFLILWLNEVEFLGGCKLLPRNTLQILSPNTSLQLLKWVEQNFFSYT